MADAREAMFSSDGELAACTTRGVKPTAASGGDPLSILTFAHRDEQLTLTLRHAAHSSVHTGGYVWSASRHLAKWLYARRDLVKGRRILELGCGLALPSILAAKCGAHVVATDELPALLEHIRLNARLNGVCEVEAQSLDFTERAEVLSFADSYGSSLGLILFSDCVFSASMGEALPHALAALLLASPDSVAVGVFPSQMRAGIEQFWSHASRLGLEWTAHEADSTPDDPRCGRLYIFRAPAACAASLAESAWMWTDESREESMLAPIFDLSDEEQLDEPPTSLLSSGADDNVPKAKPNTPTSDSDIYICPVCDSTSPCSVRPCVRPADK